MKELRLKIRNKFSGFTVCEDEHWPNMWRVHSPDGRISDMVNLPRAKDAALSAAHIGGGASHHWDPRQSRSGEPQGGLNGEAA